MLLIVVDANEQVAGGGRGPPVGGYSPADGDAGRSGVDLLQVPVAAVEPHVLDVAFGVEVGEVLLVVVDAHEQVADGRGGGCHEAT